MTLNTLWHIDASHVTACVTIVSQLPLTSWLCLLEVLLSRGFGMQTFLKRTFRKLAHPFKGQQEQIKLGADGSATVSSAGPVTRCTLSHLERGPIYVRCSRVPDMWPREGRRSHTASMQIVLCPRNWPSQHTTTALSAFLQINKDCVGREPREADCRTTIKPSHHKGWE